MSLASPQVVFSLGLLAVLVSAAITRIAIVYADRRGLVDAPGARRSHAVPTPRGGGVGIVTAVMLFGFAPVLALDPVGTGGAMLALGAVALVGWIDDHRPLGAGIRLAAHLAASALVVATTFGLDTASTLPIAALFALAIAWSINLHNFMDGIDGLLACQSLFVFGAILLAAVHAAGEAPLLAPAVALGATLGFLPFNFPRARIFLGDVGSGALGLLVAVIGGFAVVADVLSLPALLVLCSAFLVDAGCTLASRVLGGKRWYRAHREHLYQWLVRTGCSHAQVVGYYMVWNVLFALPAALVMEAFTRTVTATGSAHSLYLWVVAGLVLALGSTLWWLVKRHCVARARQGYRAV